MTLADLNRLSESRAEAEFQRCCGSIRWARMMALERPFASVELLAAVAQRLWWALDAADWLEAFAAHPRIGERAISTWSAEEQASSASAPGAVRDRLTHGNHEYERRFGYTFLICATDKSAEEIADALDRRLRHEPGDELQIAADEQRRITELRLRKLLRS